MRSIRELRGNMDTTIYNTIIDMPRPGQKIIGIYHDCEVPLKYCIRPAKWGKPVRPCWVSKQGQLMAMPMKWREYED